MKTEQEMREETAPTFDTVEELQGYITSLVERNHDYGTCCYAMSLAATAAFNFVASKLGVTGFQASCADLDIFRRTRRLEGPFVILTGENELYPQYDNHRKLEECRVKWKDWISEQAKAKLDEAADSAHPNVVAHWKKISGFESRANLPSE
jgi:hypothetical protein